MMRRFVLIVVGAVTLVGAFALGRASAPEPSITIEEKGRSESTETVAATVETREVRTEERTVEEHRDVVRIVYRERLPDGTERSLETTQRLERITEQTEGHGSREQVESRVEVRTEVVEVERLVRVESAPPRWLVGAVGGIGLDGELVYGPQVHYRVAGPIHVSGAVLLGGGATAALVGVAISF